MTNCYWLIIGFPGEVKKITTLPISRKLAETYILHAVEPPWFIHLLNINLHQAELETAKSRINGYLD